MSELNINKIELGQALACVKEDRVVILRSRPIGDERNGYAFKMTGIGADLIESLPKEFLELTVSNIDMGLISLKLILD